MTKLEKKSELNAGTTKRYYVRKPTDRRIRFALVESTTINGKESKKTISNPEIDSINHLYIEKKIGYETALAKCNEVRKFLNAKHTKLSDRLQVYAKLAHPSNIKLLEAYWDEVYSPRLINLVDVGAAKDKLYRSIRALGNDIDLIIDSHAKIAEHIRNMKAENNQKREIVAKVNQLLKYAKRNFTLSMPKKQRPNPKYLTEAEFTDLMKKVEDPVEKAIYEVAFYSGARQGEILAMRPEAINDNRIYIAEQVQEGELREPKHSSARWAYILPEAIEGIEVIANAREAGVLPSANVLTKNFTALCKANFDMKEKHCTFHCLRHSYAIYLLGFGIPIDNIAQSLGNSSAVCSEYYAGKSMTIPSMNLIDSIIKNKRKDPR